MWQPRAPGKTKYSPASGGQVPPAEPAQEPVRPSTYADVVVRIVARQVRLARPLPQVHLAAGLAAREREAARDPQPTVHRPMQRTVLTRATHRARHDLDARDRRQARRRVQIPSVGAGRRRLVHPGIVAVLGAGVENALGWLAMEAVPGISLGRYTHPARLLPEPLVLHVAEVVAGALEHAHGQGVVHRDVKPANILVHWPSDTIKLADFGLARATDADQTATGVVPGSPAFMAPELLAGSVPTPASDFYALGVTLFQLLTGRLPHEAETLGELLRRVSSQPAPDLRTWRPELPAPLAGLVASLLAIDPACRPGGGPALRQALQEALHPVQGADSGAKSR